MTFGWHSDDRERCQSLGLGPGQTPGVNFFSTRENPFSEPTRKNAQHDSFLGCKNIFVGSATGPGPGPVADPAGGTGPDLWPPTLREAQARTCGPRPFESEPRPGPGPDPGCEDFFDPRKNCSPNPSERMHRTIFFWCAKKIGRVRNRAGPETGPGGRGPEVRQVPLPHSCEGSRPTGAVGKIPKTRCIRYTEFLGVCPIAPAGLEPSQERVRGVE